MGKKDSGDSAIETSKPPTNSYVRDRKKDPTVPLAVEVPEGTSANDDLLHTLADAILHTPSLPIIKRRTIEEKLFAIKDPDGYQKELQRRADVDNPPTIRNNEIFVETVQ